MTCIFKRSKYYATATLNPQDIVEPIGYKFLNEAEEKKPAKAKKYGQAKNLFLVDKSLIRHISSLRTYSADVIKNLKENESARKNFYMNGQNTDMLTKGSTIDMIWELRGNFFKNCSQEFIQFLELVILLHTSDYYLQIRDFALSTYFVYYHGENKRFYNQLESTLISEFLQYQHVIIINSPKLSRPQLRKITNYENIKEVEDYIREINEIGKEKDPFYTGLHLFISDFLPECSPMGFAQEEKQFWPFLQFNILVVMSTLAEGQNAIIRVKGTFTHKTSEYIYLLKMAFSRVNFQKNIISNPFSFDKYVVCQNFNKENGKIIAQYLRNNYDLLYKFWDERLLVDPKVTFTNDFQKNIITFNDFLPIMKAVKDITAQFHQNSNINVYPNREALLKKMADIKLKNFNDLCLEMQGILPSSIQKKQEPTKKEIVEKESVAIDFSKFIPDQPKKVAPTLHDISKKQKNDMEDIYNNYVSLGNKNIKQKKQKSKKKKTEKESDM